MKRKLYRVIALVTLFFMLFSSNASVSAAIQELLPKEFLLEFEIESAVNSKHMENLSGIKVDVYSSTLTSYDKLSGISEYTHSFAFSTYTDSNGSTVFKKPSDEFLIMVNESSLPKNTGIEMQTKFYRNDKNSDCIEISEIDNIEVEQDNNSEHGIVVNIYNHNGNRINANYVIYEGKSNVNNLCSLSSNTISGVVEAGDNIIPYEFKTEYTIEQRLNLVNMWVQEDKITKYDALQTYIDIYKEYGISEEIYEKVSELCNNSRVITSLSENQQRLVNEIISEPSYNRSYSSGRFEIRYTSSSSSVPIFITSIMSALQNGDDGDVYHADVSFSAGTYGLSISLTSTHSFSCGYYNDSKNIYVVYP